MPFTGGPSVRVSPNSKIEIRWIADFVGDGKVEIFDNASGGTQVAVKTTPTSGSEHRVEFPVSDTGVIKPDSTFFFRITHTDTAGVRADLTNDPAPYPSFFTGAQAIANLTVTAGVESADVSWEANVIGTGSIVYGINALDQGPLTDTQNVLNHAFALSGLTAGSTYQFKVTNRHAIAGDALAEATGQFQTQQPTTSTTTFNLVEPHAEPRTIDPSAVSTLSIRAQSAGNPVANAVVQFAIDPASQGSGSFAGAQTAQATTNANGVASVTFTGGNRGNVHVNVTSASATNSHKITVVVKRV